MCRTIAQGTARQARVDRGNFLSIKRIDGSAEVMVVEYEPASWKCYSDDVSGTELRGDLVEEARNVSERGLNCF